MCVYTGQELFLEVLWVKHKHDCFDLFFWPHWQLLWFTVDSVLKDHTWHGLGDPYVVLGIEAGSNVQGKCHICCALSTSPEGIFF